MRLIPQSSRKMMVMLLALLMILAAAGLYWALTQSELAAGRKIAVIPADAREVRLLTNDGGELTYRVTWLNGQSININPTEFAKLIELEYRERAMYMRLLNVTSSAGLLWVAVGLLAQLVFMARMIVQWVASEKSKRSVVPPMFWWLSLVGASMLIIYFIWRRDAIGVLGQATGWVVYVRNLMLLRRESLGMNNTDTIGDSEPVPEPVSEPAPEPLAE